MPARLAGGTGNHFQTPPARAGVDACNLDLHSKTSRAELLAMWYSNLYRNVLQRLENLDFHQFSLLVIIIVVFGFYCLRGFGSRSNY